MPLFEITYAQSGRTLSSISTEFVFVVQTIITTLVILTLIFFLWNLAKFLFSMSSSSSERATLKGSLLWGLVALFVLSAIYGISILIADFFGVTVSALLLNEVYAQSELGDNITGSFTIVNSVLITIVSLIFVLAILFFVYRLLTYFIIAGDTTDKAEKKNYIVSSFIILFVMFSFFSIIFLARDFFGIPETESGTTIGFKAPPTELSGNVVAFRTPGGKYVGSQGDLDCYSYENEGGAVRCYYPTVSVETPPSKQKPKLPSSDEVSNNNDSLECIEEIGRAGPYTVCYPRDNESEENIFAPCERDRESQECIEALREVEEVQKDLGPRRLNREELLAFCNSDPYRQIEGRCLENFQNYEIEKLAKELEDARDKLLGEENWCADINVINREDGVKCTKGKDRAQKAVTAAEDNLKAAKRRLQTAINNRAAYEELKYQNLLFLNPGLVTPKEDATGDEIEAEKAYWREIAKGMEELDTEEKQKAWVEKKVAETSYIGNRAITEGLDPNGKGTKDLQRSIDLQIEGANYKKREDDARETYRLSEEAGVDPDHPDQLLRAHIELISSIKRRENALEQIQHDNERSETGDKLNSKYGGSRTAVENEIRREIRERECINAPDLCRQARSLLDSGGPEIFGYDKISEFVIEKTQDKFYETCNSGTVRRTELQENLCGWLFNR